MTSLLIDFEDDLTLRVKSSKVELWKGKYSEAEKKIYLRATSKNKYSTCELIGTLAAPKEFKEEDGSPGFLYSAFCLGWWSVALSVGQGAACIPWWHP